MVTAKSTALAQALLLGQFKANNRTRSIGMPNTTSARGYLAGGVRIGRAGGAIAEIGTAFKQTLLHTQFEAIRRVQIG